MTGRNLHALPMRGRGRGPGISLYGLALAHSADTGASVCDATCTLLHLYRDCSQSIMVLMESVVSGHQFIMIRERLAEKLELIRFDPYIQAESVYKERKKIRSM
ncbi:hypothetical protein B566_EDAN011998 [Ephemera danica]|nr:hypothetical protein B566_EDAN011998 [Ephemera danica]